MKILKNILAIIGLITVIALVFVYTFGGVIVNYNDEEIYNSIQVGYDFEILRVLEDIEENQHDILSKMDTICDKLDKIRR